MKISLYCSRPAWTESSELYLNMGGVVYVRLDLSICWEKQLELDVVTAKEHRRKGLAIACASVLLLNCRTRGLSVHWDAQNPASRSMSEKLGYRLDCTYQAYSFIAPEQP